MTPAKATHIARIALVVSDLAVAASFYERALGFDTVGEGRGPQGAWRRLRLGDQEIHLLAFTSPGCPYPSPRAANDQWFQHFAIAVNDMAAAYAQLCRHEHEPISRGGPQLLPPSTGSVTAYKFRDPDGHPLELSLIPGSPWLERNGGPFLGIDHTAVASRDLVSSIAFYEDLGFRVSGRGLNQGPEQDRLDGLSGVRLDIVALETREAGPHIELLHYRTPPAQEARGSLGDKDIASTRLVMVTEGPNAVLRDPDGRLLELRAG